MARPKPELVLSDDERLKLTLWASRPKSTQRLALRARIILACAEEPSNKAVAAGGEALWRVGGREGRGPAPPRPPAAAPGAPGPGRARPPRLRPPRDDLLVRRAERAQRAGHGQVPPPASAPGVRQVPRPPRR